MGVAVKREWVEAARAHGWRDKASATPTMNLILARLRTAAAQLSSRKSVKARG